MEKPNIEVKPSDKFPQMGDHFWINGRALTLEQIEVRYSSMINALVATNDYLGEKTTVGGSGVPEDEVDEFSYVSNLIINALKKAGCTNE